MPIYPGRTTGTWRVVVWADKRQHERIVEGKEADARDAEARLRIEVRSQQYRTPQRTEPLMPGFCAEEYEPRVRGHLGARTWSTRSSILAVFAEFFARLRPSEITLAAISQFKTYRLQTTAASTVNHELSVLGAVLKCAREDCGYPVPVLRIRKLPEEERRVHVWSPSEQSRLLAACRRDDPRMLPMLVFLLQTGCRKGEAIAAPWRWVDARRGDPMLLIGPTEYWSPKSKRPREVPVTSELWRMLERLPRRSDWIFPRHDGERFRWFPGVRFAAVVRAAKLEGGPHTCRHSFASRFLDAGGSLYDLAALLGHSATRTTELYAHLMPTHLERARAVLNATAKLPRTG